MAFPTHFKDIYNTKLSSANIFPNDNGDISDENELSDDALTEAYKTLNLKCLKNPKTKPYLWSLLQEVEHLNSKPEGMTKWSHAKLS